MKKEEVYVQDKTLWLYDQLELLKPPYTDN